MSPERPRYIEMVGDVTDLGTEYEYDLGLHKRRAAIVKYSGLDLRGHRLSEATLLERRLVRAGNGKEVDR